VRASRLRLLASVALSTSFIFGLLSGTAHAGGASSSYGYYTVAGIQYQNQASIWTDPSYNHEVEADTLVGPYSGGTAQDGWVGALPQTYRNGVLYCTGTWIYNSSPMPVGSQLYNAGCLQFNIVDVWSSKGITRAWNGYSYNSYYTFMTPNQNS
jgi:hypothetical protein